MPYKLIKLSNKIATVVANNGQSISLKYKLKLLKLFLRSIGFEKIRIIEDISRGYNSNVFYFSRNSKWPAYFKVSFCSRQESSDYRCIYANNIFLLIQ